MRQRRLLLPSQAACALRKSPCGQWETRCLQRIFSPCLPGGSASRSSPTLKVSMPQTPGTSRPQIQTISPNFPLSLKLLPSMQVSQGDVAYLSRLKSGNSQRNPIFQKEKKNLDSSPWSLTCPRPWPPYRGSFSVGNTHSKAPGHPQGSSWGSRTTCPHELAALTAVVKVLG